MPLLISSIARSAGVASLSSTIAAIAPSSRTMRPYPCGPIDARRQDRRGGADALRASRPAPAASSAEAAARRPTAAPRSRVRRQVRLRLQQRVAGAQLRLLQCKPQARPFPKRALRPRLPWWPTTDHGRSRVRANQRCAGRARSDGNPRGTVQHFRVARTSCACPCRRRESRRECRTYGDDKLAMRTRYPTVTGVRRGSRSSAAGLSRAERDGLGRRETRFGRRRVERRRGNAGGPAAIRGRDPAARASGSRG